MADENGTTFLNARDMALRAGQYRRQFDVGLSDKVDILELIEFKLADAFPGFHLVIVQDHEIEAYANTSFSPPCIIVRQSVYNAASEGSHFERMILAHELGHFLLHSEHKNRLPAAAPSDITYTENIKSLNGLESAEAQANLFAKLFLVPPFLAFKYRSDPLLLSKIAGVPSSDAIASIKISKRQEMYVLTNPITALPSPLVGEGVALD